jgi:hypothetical protein
METPTLPTHCFQPMKDCGVNLPTIITFPIHEFHIENDISGRVIPNQ